MSQVSSAALIIGASSGVGRALAEQLAKKGYKLLLVARQERDLSALANHLNQTTSGKVSYLSLDLSNWNEEKSQRLFERAENSLGDVSRLFLISGANSESDQFPLSSRTLSSLFEVNALAPIHIANQITTEHKKWKLKSITVCSSIAAPVPRSRNIAYATAKAALESFVTGCRHYLSSQNIPFQIYRLGYVDTNLSFGQKLLFPAISPENVAQVLIKKSDKDLGIVYLPFYWRFIILVLKALPWTIYKKLSF
ncbi:MAG: SDR family NAD(P)-dependent oxidoreductase [Bdellovibrionales bacterium]|nr:SDR family NAD(P)-dependent oxidoreductase [Bdellovibrionales bacterium]